MILAKTMAAAAALALAVSTVATASAMPIVPTPSPLKVQGPAHVEEVRHKRGHRHRGHHSGGKRNWDRLGAGIAGAVIGGIIANQYAPRYHYAPRYVPAPPRVYHRGGLPVAHVQWCDARYRSYRAWDNSFQPYHGPRRQCISPYVR